MTATLPRQAYSKEEHDKQVGSYGQYDNLLLGILEHQLQESALGDCKGITVLDLGGGQGLRARHAVELGAVAVDVVDCRFCSIPSIYTAYYYNHCFIPVPEAHPLVCPAKF